MEQQRGNLKEALGALLLANAVLQGHKHECHKQLCAIMQNHSCYCFETHFKYFGQLVWRDAVAANTRSICTRLVITCFQNTAYQ